MTLPHSQMSPESVAKRQAYYRVYNKSHTALMKQRGCKYKGLWLKKSHVEHLERRKELTGETCTSQIRRMIERDMLG